MQQAHFGKLSHFNFKNIHAVYTGDKPTTSLLRLAVGFSPYRRGDYQGGIQDVHQRHPFHGESDNTPKVSMNAFGFSEQAAVRDVRVQGIEVNGNAAKVRPAIEQYAYNIALGDQTIKEGTRPTAEPPFRKYPPVAAAANPAKAYPRRDEDGDKFGRKIAHQIAYPGANQKTDPGFPKNLSAAFGNNATGEPRWDQNHFRSAG